jgi:gluconokinase
MGVSGSGKTTVGRLLAKDLGWPFRDADDFHPAANLEKMRNGVPLTDEDRAPWLDVVHDMIVALDRDGRSVVLACSALKQSYRERITDGVSVVRVIYLRGDASLIRLRLARRSGHFFPLALLQSQVDALEEPVDAIIVDIDAHAEEIAAQIAAQLRG